MRIIRGGEVKVIGRVGIIKNAHDETAALVGAPVSAGDAAIDALLRIEARDLAESRAMMARLPFDERQLYIPPDDNWISCSDLTRPVVNDN